MINKKISVSDHGYFELYLLNNSKHFQQNKKRPLVIICPGGCYTFTSDTEAEPIALKFNTLGFHSAVLRYTVNDYVKHVPQQALIEVARTIAKVRENSEEWYVDTNKIILVGFSAGGHVVGQIASKWHKKELADEIGVTNEQIKVNLAVVGYPSIYMEEPWPKDSIGMCTEWLDNDKEPMLGNVRAFGTANPTQEDVDNYSIITHLTKNCPPMFIWHTFADHGQYTDVNNSLKLANKLRDLDVPFELHIFEKGDHGLSLANEVTARNKSQINKHVAKWFDLCKDWIYEYLEKK